MVGNIMLVYFKKYTIGVCVIAAGLPIVVSTIWPMYTGSIMASSLRGLVLLFALFVLGFFIGFWIFSRIADSKTDDYLSVYNDDCDPERFLELAQPIASAITFPCNENGAWFMSYYAQALLDTGKAEEAMKVKDELQSTLKATTRPDRKCAILVNMVPLAEKIEDPSNAMNLIEEGIGLCKGSPDSAMRQRYEFLNGQKQIMQVRIEGNLEDRAKLDSKITEDGMYPMRIRVEYAFDAASTLYKLGSTSDERKMLDFVVENGGKLRLVAKAKERLAS